jgi:excisionase family DNA binding protein
MIAPVEPAVRKLALTLSETAESLSVCERTVTRLIARGELRAVRIGPRGLRVAVSDIEAWMAKQTPGATP